MIPIYTTDTVPVTGAGAVQQAWPVWAEADEIGRGLDLLAQSATARGAHAIIGLKLTFQDPSSAPGWSQAPRYVFLGTAVALAST
ncbi:hypothetical protein ACQP1W_03295 [Spirillospora sp. CA-255316]